MPMNPKQPPPGTMVALATLLGGWLAGLTLVSPAQAGPPVLLADKDKVQKDRGSSYKLPEGVPAKVAKVLKYIDEHKKAPPGYEGGRPFLNLEKRLPRKDKRGRVIKYQEWDVNRKVRGKNRGPERLVTGSDGSAYYTADHYKTFIKIR
jgi:guanyl-specific ribonuclease Sa